MDRVILHSDMNHCYAAIELLHHPELRGKPVAVGGDPEARHGIILAKDPLAKKAGVKTGMALWEAREACPDLAVLPPHMDLYLRFSRIAHEIYAEYTDQWEPFGIDECWLDVTASAGCRGDGEAIAREINARMKSELGITVSVGVSWNKIFAKLGSDYRKPDAVTAVSRENYREIAWPLPAGDLLYVGRATRRKLQKYGIGTIGELARTDPAFLEQRFGKMGLVLSCFARGEDRTPVRREDASAPVKSIGNSTTAPRDLVCMEDVKIVIYVLAESVAARLREAHFKCRTVEISVRDRDLYSFTRQRKLEMPTDLTSEIAEAAFRLFREQYGWQKPVRSIGVRACRLTDVDTPVQLNFFFDEERREKEHRMDLAADSIRARFGYGSLQRGLMYQDRVLAALDAKEEHTVHPRGYFEDGNRTGAEEMKDAG